MEQAQLLFEGKYEILAKIREGGMGTVYRVRHRLLDEIRVVKVMQPHVVADADLQRRFLEEAKTAIRLKHPNICTIYDFAADERGTAYLVMEYIDGVSLADFLKSRGMPDVPLAMQIAHQTLLALGYLHRRGIIHRDIAPDNLMLTHDDEQHPVVKLIDLGIAKVVNREADMTATGIFLGKPKYASPEQFGAIAEGEKLDGRSDLYGLGVVLYELLTGMRPYRGKSPTELLRAQHLNLLIPFEESDPHRRVPPTLRAAVLKALEKKREDRYASAEEFDRKLVELMEDYTASQAVRITPDMLSRIRPAQPTSDHVTPSAQDRLDRHFGVQATPSPSAPLLTIVPPPQEDSGAHTIRIPVAGWASENRRSTEEDVHKPERTKVAPLAAEEEEQIPSPTTDTPPPLPVAAVEIALPSLDEAVELPSIRESRLLRIPRRTWLLPVSAVAVAAALVLFLWRPWEVREAAEVKREAPAASEPAPAGAAIGDASPVVVEPPPSGEPAAPPALVQEPANAPSPQDDVSTSSAPIASPEPPDPVQLAALAESSRAAAAAARSDADQSGGHDLAPVVYARAFAKQMAATRLLEQGSPADATKLFDEARDLYRRATAAPGPKFRREASVAAPDSRPRPPLAPAEPPLDPAAMEEARPQIVKVVGDYAWARRTRDEKLFAQVFPSDMTRFQRTLKTFERQDVRIDIRSIDFEGAHAVVSANEVVIGTTQGGAEIRNESQVTLQLANKGGRWVIVSRRES